MTNSLTPEQIAELRASAKTITWPVVHHDVLSALLDAAEELEREKSRPGSPSAWAQMRLERDLAREERDALRAEVERLKREVERLKALHDKHCGLAACDYRDTTKDMP